MLLRGFPFLKLFSLSFVVSTAMLIASNYMWISHFTSHYHHMMHVFCFLMFNVWLVPFGFFVSLSINEAVLPDRLASSARETYSEGVKHVLLRLLFLLLIQLAHGSSAASKSTRPRDGASSLLRCDRAPSAPPSSARPALFVKGLLPSIANQVAARRRSAASSQSSAMCKKKRRT